MDVIKVRGAYQITVSRRALLTILAISFFSIGAGVIIAVAPLLRDAVVVTHQNAAAVHDAIQQSEALRLAVDEFSHRGCL